MKNQKKIIVIVLFAILMLILFFRNCEDNSKRPVNENKSKNKVTTQTKDLPIPGIDIPFQTFTVDPTKETVLTANFGTTINIPKDAFLDDNGNVIKEKVTVNFREFNNPLEFYLANIPMNFVEDGVEKTLESAGMIEINASVNTKPVFVNSKNKINVSLFSWTKSKDFNLYDLDKETGQWIEKGKDVVAVSSISEQEEQLPTIPPVPQIASTDAFRIADDTKLFPEINDYKDILFEPIDPSKCTISNAQEMSVKQLPNGVIEVVSVLKYGTIRKENSCKCYIAFEKGVSYNKALERYKKKYQKELEVRDRIKAKIQKEWDIYISAVQAHKNIAFQKLSSEEKIIRTLAINNFGFVNIDFPTSYPEGGEFNPMYVNESGKAIDLKNVVLVEKKTNALFRYANKVKFNPNNKNVLWGILPNSKIAFIKEEDFKLIKNTKEKQKIVMHVFDKKLSTYDDVNNLLMK